MMQKVPINLVKPGMVLAKPVLNEQGMALCAEGTELTAVLIDRLKRMNVSFITLKGTPLKTAGPTQSLEESIRQTRARFARVEGDPIMDTIRDAIVEALAAESPEQRDDPEDAEEGPGG